MESMKKVFLALLLLCSNAWAVTFTDLKFGQAQIADSQWNVQSCTQTATCQIYSKNPGTAYKIPWYNGQLSWAAGDYVAFAATGDATNPWNAVQYNSSGAQKAVMGTGHIINMGTDYFFFVGNDNNTGQLFSMTTGFNSTAGVTWTGTLNPTVSQVNTYAATGSTTPLAPGQTATPAAPVVNNATITSQSTGLYVTNVYPTSNNSPAGETADKAIDGNPSTKYLNFDRANSGFTLKLNQGRVVSGIRFTTANDFEARDPSKYTLYGSNNGVDWTKIVDKASIALPSARFTNTAILPITNTNAYVYYYIVFDSIKAIDQYGSIAGCQAALGTLACDSVQIAEVTLIYDTNNTTISTDTSGGSVVVNPGSNTLCCGGTSTAFNKNTVHDSRMQNFIYRGTTDNQINITQVGNYNSATVTQNGHNNRADTGVTGSNNDVTITQSSTSSTTANYTEVWVAGSSNTANVIQQSTGGSKGAFVSINDSSNTVAVQQKDNGSHYASINVSGSNKTVDLLQQGSAGHMASITLSGGSTSINTTQSGSTQQYYSITHSCATVSCTAITVTQGQ
jgi:hypothetical protein